MTDQPGATMAMPPERVAERVELLTEAIRGGVSDEFAEHSAPLTIYYNRQVHDMGTINAAQFADLVRAVNEVADSWLPKLDTDGIPLEG